MAWSNSKIFAQFVLAALDRTTDHDLDTNTPKVALYNNTGTPSNTVSLANSAYNVDQWVTTSETYEAGQWAQGGVVLAGHDVTVSSTTIMWDANDTASGSTADITNAYGCLVYDDTLTTPVADQGMSFNYLGGANSIVSGTFTVVWNASGIFVLTL